MYSKIKILSVLIFQFICTVLIQAQSSEFPIYKHHNTYLSLFHTTLDSNFEKYDVLKYKINLSINPDSREISGNVDFQFEVLENNFSILMLNLNGLQVDSIKQESNWLNYNRQQNELYITLGQPLQSGSLDSISIFYHGVPIKGMYFRNNKFNNKVIYTHNEPYDAQYWFPCKDDPSDKALLDVWITVPQNLKVVSNGILTETTPAGQGKLKYYWKESYPISTYLISMAASNYDIISNPFNWNLIQFPVEYYIYPEEVSRGNAAISNTIEMLDFFSNYIGSYPFHLEKYAMVEVPFQEAAAMENQTITTMDEPVIDNESVIAHELVHQWWGDALTPSSFNDIWLNEGFATYFDALFIEHKFGEDVFKARMISSSSQVSSDGSVDYAIYNPPMQFLFGSAVYHKGAWVLHMLRNELGKDVFKTIIRNYYNNFIYKNVSTNDFIDICENVSGRSLHKYFDQWVFSPGIPNLFASWTQKNNNAIIRIDQMQNETIYELNLDLKLIGLTRDTTFSITIFSQNEEYVIPFSDQISQLILDPENKVLNINNGPVYLIPNRTELIQLFPNPFNSELNIFYRVEKLQNIRIELWDILGKKIKTLQNGKKQIGTHKLTWKVENLASGTYICVLKSESNIDKRKVVLIK